MCRKRGVSTAGIKKDLTNRLAHCQVMKVCRVGCNRWCTGGHWNVPGMHDVSSTAAFAQFLDNEANMRPLLSRPHRAAVAKEIPSWQVHPSRTTVLRAAVVQESLADEWDDIAESHRRSTLYCSGRALPKEDRGRTDEINAFLERHVAPAMPTIRREPKEHRDKLSAHDLPFNLMVARPVGRQEMTDNPTAKAAMKKEWDTLVTQKVWDVLVVEEKSKVIADARRDGRTVQFGRVHGICVEKNYELPEGHLSRKYKGRVVFLGNQVKNQNFEQATFMDMGNSPATIESARLCDFFGCLYDNNVSVADAVQAYIQAFLGGDACWINLPKDAYPAADRTMIFEHPDAERDYLEAVKKWNTMTNPVTILRMALCGHTDSVTMWELKCDEDVKSVGFRPLGAEWPSVYFHSELSLLLVIYVDDFKLAGPDKNIAKGWALLRSKLSIGPDGPLGMYLGCNQSRVKIELPGKIPAMCIIYDMESFLEQCVARYLEVAGKNIKFKEAKTPFLADEGVHGPARDPMKGDLPCCSWCGYVEVLSTSAGSASAVGGGRSLGYRRG